VVIVAPVPPPNLMAERHSDAVSEHWESAYCDACTKDFNVCVRNEFFDISVEVEGGIQVEFDVTQFPDDEEIQEIIRLTDQCSRFEQGMKEVILLAEMDAPESSQNTLYNLLHTQAITLIETYLSTVLIHEVMNCESNFQRLVETDPELGKRKFSLKEIFTEYDSLKLTVAKHLSAIMYHNIAKVGKLYLGALGIDIRAEEWLYVAIVKRHDCVHRNGQTKDQQPVTTSKNELLEVARQAGKFVAGIDQQVAYAREQRT